MLRAALGFFIIGLIAVLLGANNVAGVSMEVGKLLLFVFLALAVLSTLIGLMGGGKSSRKIGMWLVAGLSLAGVSAHSARADETVLEKGQTKVEESTKDAKKQLRNWKK